MASESNLVLKLVTVTSGLFLIAFDDSHKLCSGVMREEKK